MSLPTSRKNFVSLGVNSDAETNVSLNAKDAKDVKNIKDVKDIKEVKTALCTQICVQGDWRVWKIIPQDAGECSISGVTPATPIPNIKPLTPSNSRKRTDGVKGIKTKTPIRILNLRDQIELRQRKIDEGIRLASSSFSSSNSIK